MTHPTIATERAKRRAKLETDGAERGRRRAIETYSSIRCALGSHAPHGCQNNGTGCLCACHDPKEQQP